MAHDPISPRQSVEPGSQPQVTSDPPGTGDERDRASAVRRLTEWAVIGVAAVLVALLVKTFLLQAFYIPSLSMFPTLKEGDRVLVNKLSYKLHEVNRGDLVVFESLPGEGTERDLIKRVIALPGETVEGRDGHVLVNGRALDESYLAPEVRTEAFAVRTVPGGQYWVMGDNRGSSRDSRFFGAVPKSRIIGRAFVRVWPLPSLTLL